MRWRDDVRTCKCGLMFIPKRERQRFCSSTCATKDRVTRHRSRYIEPTPTVLPEKPLHAPQPLSGGLGDGSTMLWPQRDFHHGPTPGALQGDDYPLEYHEDGYPKLPDCLDRRPKAQPLAKAA